MFIFYFRLKQPLTAIKCLPFTSDSKDEGTYGNDPGHSTVALPKFFHEILEKDTQALENPIGTNLDYKEGCSHSPTPAAFRHVWVNIWTQTLLEIGRPHGNSSWPPVGRNRNITSEFIRFSIDKVIYEQEMVYSNIQIHKIKKHCTS